MTHICLRLYLPCSVSRALFTPISILHIHSEFVARIKRLYLVLYTYKSSDPVDGAFDPVHNIEYCISYAEKYKV